MIIDIEISSSVEYVKIFADLQNNIFLINEKNAHMPIYEFKERLLDIVLFWKNDENISEFFDMEKYFINIQTESKTFTFSGQGTYPENYSDFKQLISEAING